MTQTAVQQRSGYGARIAVGMLAPAPLGVLLLLAVSMLSIPKPINLDELWLMPLGYIGVSLVGYLLVGAQSVIYALLMEYVINRRLKNDLAVLALSALLGALGGVSLLLFFPHAEALFSGVLIVIGTVAGLGVGHVLRRMYKQAANNTARDEAASATGCKR